MHFNSHAHCFTIDHVPEKFFDELIGGKRFLRISKLKKSKFLQLVLRVLTSNFVRSIIKLFSKNAARQLRRLNGLLKYSTEKTQLDLIKDLDRYYQENYRFVLLSMDMHSMGAGAPSEDFLVQLEKLKVIKQEPEWQDKIFPFVFADPARANITDWVKKYLAEPGAPFQGIKLYPAVGYFPFDKRLKEIYQFAIEHDVPLLTHCILGDVYQRNENYYKLFPVHPISKQSTVPEKNYTEPENFQLNFTHPLNFECLLNPNIISAYYGEKVDFSRLKICLGHFGGEDEWAIYKKQQSASSTTYKQVYEFEPLDIRQPWLGNSNQRYNWLTIIKELIRKYPNVYADISFTLHDVKIYPILKNMLKDQTLKDKILYGTDFYVVATVTDEPKLIRMVKKYLSAAEIKLISYDNPLKFLSSNLNPIKL